MWQVDGDPPRGQDTVSFRLSVYEAPVFLASFVCKVAHQGEPGKVGFQTSLSRFAAPWCLSDVPFRSVCIRMRYF